MPGITIAYEWPGFAATSGTYPGHPGFSVQKQPFPLLSSMQAIALLTPDYPFEYFQNERFTFAFEGIAYGAPQPESLFREFTSADGIQTAKIQHFIEKTDGEFVIVLCDLMHGEFLLASDRFGRLPLYFTQNGSSWIISRNIRHLLDLMGSSATDAHAMAQQLLFGYALQKRTLYKDVNRLPPSVLFSFSEKCRNVKYQSNFQYPEIEKQPIYRPDLLLDTLWTALQNRIQKHPNAALSLSGGLDSRLLLGALARQNTQIPLFTYLDKEGTAEADIIAVNQMLRHTNCEKLHTLVPLTATTKSSLELLFNIKAGLNPLEMAFIIPYLEYLQQKALVQITGDGGDKVLAGLEPIIPVKTEKSLIRYLLLHHKSPPLSLVAAISGLSIKSITDSLYLAIEEYADKNPLTTYRNFMLRERAMQWLFEGEDRNRFFGWSTTPYYHPDLFDLVMQLPEDKKVWGKLFKQLFELLPGNLSSINNPNWKAAPADSAAINKLLIKQKVRFYLPVVFSEFLNQSPMAIQKSFRWNDILMQHLPPEIKERLPDKLPEVLWYRLMSFRKQLSD